MKTFFKSLKRQAGFTLVELMVVVAIIGLLSAVAVPNFRKYQAKAKMSEAKLQLSALYSAEAAFFSDFNMYSNCLAYMGYNPQKEVTNRYYAIGFTVAAAINSTTYLSAQYSGLQTDTTNGCPRTNGASTPATAVSTTAVLTTHTWFWAGKGVGSVVAQSAAFIPTTANHLGIQADTPTMVFTAGAAGVIDGDYVAATTASLLSINHDKVFSVLRNGY
jgi:type IV pilus assembly protein PilA